jgi:chromosome segregation ATPase
MPVEKIPSWIERVLLPKLSAIEGELKAINTRIDSVEDQVGSLRNEMLSKFEGVDIKITSLDERITSLRNEMLSKFEGVDIKITSLDERITSLRNEAKTEFTGLNYRFDYLEKRIPVIEEITALKIKIADMEKRLAMA